jgi:hypothetical protein
LRDSWAQVYECDNCRLHHQQQAHQVTYGHHQGTSTSRFTHSTVWLVLCLTL